MVGEGRNMTESRTIAQQAHDHYQAGVPTEIPVPTTSLFDLLAHSAEVYPDNIAIDYFGRQWTFKEFYDEALKAAFILREAGVRKGDTVAFAMPNCPQHFFAFYGAMRLGAAVAEHNPLAPAHQLAGQIARHGGEVAVAWNQVADKLTDSIEPKKILTIDLSDPLPWTMKAKLRLPVKAARQARKKLMGEGPAGSVSFDELLKQAAQVADRVPGATGSDRAVILHSSGTNGVPKSVPLTHTNIGANVNQNLFWVWQLDRGGTTVFSLLPYFHAFGMCFMLCAVTGMAGTQIVLPTFDADLALDAHLREPVNFFVGVPPMFAKIAQRATERDIDISTIQYAVSGGMALSAEISDAWEKATGGYIIEGYGMSETSPTISGSPMTPDRRHGCLGLPFPSTELRIVDQEDPTKDLPDGEVGELLIRGPQVFEGYLDAPEENEGAFVEGGWFRSGDLCRSDNGFIYLVDRSKDLIITSGFNVYPSEVEEAILALTSAKDAVVVGRPNPQCGEEVVAIVTANWKKPDLQRLRRTLEERLPHYALPRDLVMLDQIPRSLIGKPERARVRTALIEGEM